MSHKGLPKLENKLKTEIIRQLPPIDQLIFWHSSIYMGHIEKKTTSI